MSSEFKVFLVGALSAVAGWALTKILEDYMSKKSTGTV